MLRTRCADKPVDSDNLLSAASGAMITAQPRIERRY